MHRLCHCFGRSFNVQPVDRFVANAGFDIQLISLALCIQSLQSSFEPKSVALNQENIFLFLRYVKECSSCIIVSC
jgi:hypothetical protein